MNTQISAATESTSAKKDLRLIELLLQEKLQMIES